jgi:hypothetical protein
MSVLLDEILKEFKKLNETMGDLAISIKALIVGTVLQKENEALEVVKEVEITPKIVKESPGFKTVTSKDMEIKVLYNFTSDSGKAYNLKWVGHKGDIWLPKKLVDSMNSGFKTVEDDLQTIRVPTKIMEDKG